MMTHCWLFHSPLQPVKLSPPVAAFSCCGKKLLVSSLWWPSSEPARERLRIGMLMDCKSPMREEQIHTHTHKSPGRFPGTREPGRCVEAGRKAKKEQMSNAINAHSIERPGPRRLGVRAGRAATVRIGASSACAVLQAKDVSLPHSRQTVVICGCRQLATDVAL